MNKFALSRAEWKRFHQITKISAPPPPPRPVLGSRVSVTPTMNGTSGGPVGGTVVYINDAHYYYTVQLDIGFRESYKWGFTT